MRLESEGVSTKPSCTLTSTSRHSVKRMPKMARTLVDPVCCSGTWMRKSSSSSSFSLIVSRGSGTERGLAARTTDRIQRIHAIAHQPAQHIANATMLDQVVWRNVVGADTHLRGEVRQPAE